MNYSFRHKSFAIWLNRHYNINKQDVLDHPENYLGPNYREVLNWWFYWDSLSYAQRDVLSKRCWDLDDETREKARKTSKELASEVIDPRFTIEVIGVEYVGWFNFLSLELVAAHLYIERGIPFTFLPWIFDL